MKTIPKSVLDLIKTDDRVRYNTYDSIGIRKEKSLPRDAGALNL
jgi:hypothetical protein